MIENKTYQEISDSCSNLVISSKSRRVVMGDAFGINDTEVYDSALFEHEIHGKTEINATRQNVRPPFEWIYEITLRGEPFKHYLVQDKGKIVEAYAKNVTPVDQTGAEELLKVLQAL